MRHNDDSNPRRKLRIAQPFAACVFAVAFASVQVARYHSPSNVIFVIAGVAGIVIGSVNLVLYSRMARAQGRRVVSVKPFYFVTIFATFLLSVACIAYGYGESHYSQYALWVAVACFFVSPLFLRRGKKEDEPGVENEKRL
jgi:drug/metabolite transporter (DMT)-like permease